MNCIDGETLGAWTAGALSQAEAARVDEHLADCPRCQAMLAAFARSAPETTTVPSTVPWWQRWQIRWLVPAATAATVAALWVMDPRTTDEARPVEPDPQFYVQPKEVPAPGAPVSIPPPPGMTVAQDAPSAQSSATGAAANQRAAKEERSTAIAERGASFKNPPAAAPPASVGAVSGTQETAQRREQLASAQAPVTTEFISSDQTTVWRVIAGNRVERSTDRGASWQPVAIPANAMVTAGHSPTAGVAWLVGRGGGIYVTTDGARFERVPFVETSDLVSVVAVDNRQATVTTADGRVFRTMTRGATWTAQ